MPKPKTSANGPSQRQLRVGELLRHALSNVFRAGLNIDAPLDTRLLTITEVKMSPDLKVATIFVMPLGGGNTEQVPKILGQHAKFLRGELGRNINLKFTPDLRFRVDESFAEGARIDALLRSPFVNQDISNDQGEDDA